MAISLRTGDTMASLLDQQTAVRQVEDLGFRLLSLAIGQVSGRANLVTFVQQAGVPAKPIVLEVIDGQLSQEAQDGILNTPGRQLVCYGSLHVEGTAKNVAAWRI